MSFLQREGAGSLQRGNAYRLRCRLGIYEQSADKATEVLLM